MKRIKLRTIGVFSTLCGVVLGLLVFSSCKQHKAAVRQPAEPEELPGMMVMYGPRPAQYQKIEVQHPDSTDNGQDAATGAETER